MNNYILPLKLINILTDLYLNQQITDAIIDQTVNEFMLTGDLLSTLLFLEANITSSSFELAQSIISLTS